MDISLTKILLTHYELICFMISFCIIGVFELQWALSPTGTGIYLIRNVPAFPLLSPFLTSVSFHLIQTSSLSMWQLKPLWAWGRYASIWWCTKTAHRSNRFQGLERKKKQFWCTWSWLLFFYGWSMMAIVSSCCPQKARLPRSGDKEDEFGVNHMKQGHLGTRLHCYMMIVCLFVVCVAWVALQAWVSLMS